MTLPLPVFEVAIEPKRLPPAVVGALYVHIPFCFHKCHYCDFYSITRQSEDRMGTFVDRVLMEADQWTRGAGPTLKPRTVFFGGGTPTLLPIEQMQRLIAGLHSRIDFSECTEWTIEANPATVTPEYCTMMRAMGVDRLSFGAQSFNRQELATLERHHNPDDVPRSVELARAAGFSRLNLDLIYGIPGQSLESWIDSLEKTIAIGTPHISCYGLTYEPNTPIAVKQRMGQMIAIEESIELQMLHETRRRLIASGRPPYEISNYAQPGEECRHNLAYWLGDDYIALGPSGASHVQGTRWKNRPHLREWEESIDAGRLPAMEAEQLSANQRAGELAMLMLRLERGLVYSDYADRTGKDARELFQRPITELTKLGLIESTPTALKLTSTGLNVADSVAQQFQLDD